LGEAIAVFYKPKEGFSAEELSKNIEELILMKLGKAVKPKYIIPINELPKSRSGKILRRIIKDTITNKNIDLTLLENPESIETLRDAIHKYFK
ncbi:MAG: hypothetical protein QXW51_03865, partial [Sulfolobaceae archaeon]